MIQVCFLIAPKLVPRACNGFGFGSVSTLDAAPTTQHYRAIFQNQEEAEMRVTQAICVLSAIGFLTVSSGMEVAQAQISGTSRGPANKPAPPPPSGVKGPPPGMVEKVIRRPAPARDWSTTEVSEGYYRIRKWTA